MVDIDGPALHGDRASDSERDATAARLREAAVEGRLSFEELSDRLDASYAATHRGELDRLTNDLPDAASNGLVSAPVRDTRLFGDVKREGRWPVPARGRWRTLFGDVVLDLRGAQVTASELHISASTLLGDVEVLVPEGVRVEVRSRALFGDVRQRAGEAAPANAPTVVLSGGCVFGDVRVRHRRLHDTLLRKWTALPERDD